MMLLQIANPSTVSVTPSFLIEIGMFLLAAIGAIIAFSKMQTATNVKINENAIKILSLEKDMIVLKQDYDKQFSEIKIDFFAVVSESKRENRQDHSKLFEKLEVIGKTVVRIGTCLDTHLKENRP